MKIKIIPVGDFQVNCHILIKQKKCLIIDPGSDFNLLNDYITENKLEPVAILITHAHFDHIGAIEDFSNNYNIPIYISSKEQEFLYDPYLNGSRLFPGRKEIILNKKVNVNKLEEGSFEIGDFKLEVLDVPGHSPSGLCFHFKEHNFVIVGDVLFYRSIGRTDLYGGNMNQLVKSIKDKLLKLSDKTKVYPGHGPITTIGDEKKLNPYLS
jgi:glyoxylase-like metal-dependent hydrolase (beta-lactamase superfamily II)